MKAPRCPVCGDSGVIVGSLPGLSTSAPLLHLPCPKSCPAGIDIAHPNATPDVHSDLIEAARQGGRVGAPT